MYVSDYIIDWVERAASLNPDNTAMIAEQGNLSVTYTELMMRSEYLAVMLLKVFNQKKLTILTDDGSTTTPLVSIMMNRGIGSIVAILSVLKAGAAYVPVDPSFPADRQAHIFTHSQSQVLIVDKENLPAVKAMNLPLSQWLVIDSETGRLLESTIQHKQQQPGREEEREGEREKLQLLDKAAQRQVPSDQHLAYVLYTSGSTGKPKGVMVHNKGLVNIVEFFAETLSVSVKDRVLCLTTLCFDISMLEIFLPLICGATLVMISSKTQKNPVRILEVLQAHKISVMQATPTTYEMLMAVGWTGDRSIKMLVGGEACRPKVAQLSQNSDGMYNVHLLQ